MSLNAIVIKIINKFIQYLTIREHFKIIVIFVISAMICRRNIFIELL